MDRQSLHLKPAHAPAERDRTGAAPAQEVSSLSTPGSSTSSRSTSSVSAALAAANAYLPKLHDPGPRFPPEDGGRSFADMAGRDLDAALQLLAERAQYITAASGAAIALRRGSYPDMLCRASAGSNAPELGALLSTEQGLSGESVRTRQPLCCDDTERDPRVNREVCRQLGIASVVVMPIVSDDHVIGVFELLSGSSRGFDRRDLSALRRLSEMVEVAVRHAAAAAMPLADQPAVEDAEVKPAELQTFIEGGNVDASTSPMIEAKAAPPQPTPLSKPQEPVVAKSMPTEPLNVSAQPAAPKPLFWSAAAQAQRGARAKTDSGSVPPMLRNLQKCEACGFPVSQGRTYCVECEEKQWRGETRTPKPPQSKPAPLGVEHNAAPIPAQVAPAPDAPAMADAIELTSDKSPVTAKVEDAIDTKQAAHDPSQETSVIEAPLSATTSEDDFADSQYSAAFDSDPEPTTGFLSSATEGQSWLASNKFILGALIILAIIVGVFAALR